MLEIKDMWLSSHLEGDQLKKFEECHKRCEAFGLDKIYELAKCIEGYKRIGAGKYTKNKKAVNCTTELKKLESKKITTEDDYIKAIELIFEKKQILADNKIKIGRPYKLSDYDKDLLGIFRFFVDENHNRILLCSADQHVYITCQSSPDAIEKALVAYDIYNEYEDLYYDFPYEIHGKGEYLPDCIFGAKLVPDEEGLKKPVLLPFDEYLLGVQELLFRDPAFKIEPPKIISNSKTEPCYFYFDFNALDAEENNHPTWDEWMLQMDFSKPLVVLSHVCNHLVPAL